MITSLGVGPVWVGREAAHAPVAEKLTASVSISLPPRGGPALPGGGKAATQQLRNPPDHRIRRVEHLPVAESGNQVPGQL